MLAVRGLMGVRAAVTSAPISAALVAASLCAPALADRARVEAEHGSWTVFAAVDPMTDVGWYGALARSDTGADIQVGCAPYAPDKLNVSFRTKDFLGDGFRDAMYRVDSKAARTVTGKYNAHDVWPLCDGACKSGKSTPEVTFAAEVKGGTSLRLRLTTYRHERLDFEFRIDGAQEAFDRVRAGCARLAAEKKPR